jgi:hypothetical protein
MMISARLIIESRYSPSVEIRQGLGVNTLERAYCAELSETMDSDDGKPVLAHHVDVT